MSEPLHLHLTRVGERALPHHCPGFFQHGFLVRAGNLVLQLIGNIEVILQCTFTATGNDRHINNAGFHRLLNPVLNQWFSDNWQHFLWHRFGRRQKAGAIASRWKQAFLYSGHNKFFALIRSGWILKITVAALSW